MKKNTNVLIWASIIFLYLAWGSTYLGIRYMVAEIPPFLAAGSRNFIAGLVILMIGVFAKQTNLKGARAYGLMAIIGILLFLGGNGLITLAAKWVPSGYISLFPAAVPIWLVLWDLILNKNKPSGITILGCLVGFVGVGLLANQNQFSIAGYEAMFVPGVIFIILATIFWSLGVHLAVYVPVEGSVMMKSAWQTIFGGLSILLVSIIQGEAWVHTVQNVSQTATLAFVYLIIIGSVLGFTVFTWVSGKASATLVGTYSYVNPLVALFLGWKIAHEPMSSTVLISAALILAAVFLITYGQRKTS